MPLGKKKTARGHATLKDFCCLPTICDRESALSIEFFNEAAFDGVADEALIDVAGYALTKLDVHPAAECSLYLVDLATIEDLHVRWLDLPGPTDVMSFPIDEITPGAGRPDAAQPDPAILGDIVLCPEFALKQAARAGHSLNHELALLTVHGVLHLLGYDHVEAEEEREMFALQNELLAGWYDALSERGIDFEPKPVTPDAFPDPAARRGGSLGPGGEIPAIGEPADFAPPND